jgi:hypothetical protein
MADHDSGSRSLHTLQPGIQSSHECTQEDCTIAQELGVGIGTLYKAIGAVEKPILSEA